MADSRYHRHRAGSHRAHDDFFVEGPKILQRTAAAPHDDDINIPATGELLDAAYDILRRAIPLHLRRAQHQRKARKTPPGYRADIMLHRAGLGGNDAHRARQQRQRTLTGGVKQSLRR